MEVEMVPQWAPKILLEVPWILLGRFGDHVGSFGGSPGRPVELLGSSGRALGGSLGAFGDDVGVLGVFGDDSGPSFGYEAKADIKR